MKRWSVRTFTAAAFSSFLLAGTPAADLEAGRTIASQGTSGGSPACAACHGADGAGNAAAGFPRLAGIDADYLAHQMRAYEKNREDPIMAPIVAALTDREIRDVSAYYASLPPPAPSPDRIAADEDLMRAGERLATRGAWDRDLPACTSCHGPGGRGIDSVFPAIAGQHAVYIAKQLRAWRDGSRRGDPGALMETVARRLSDREIDAVAAWFAVQPSSLVPPTEDE